MNEALALLSFGPGGWGDELIYGAGVTVALALATLPFGLALGFLLALARNSPERSLQIAANIYTTIFRGLPELLTLFIVYFGLTLGFQKIVALFTDAYVELNSFVAGMIALGLVFSAYACEVFVSAFKAIPAGQYEAGEAVGLTQAKTLYLVILPQLIRLALPGLSNLWLILLKDTALVSTIGLADTLRNAGIAATVTKEPFLFYGAAFLIYLVFALISSAGLWRVELATQRGDWR